jgi:hypothetical protein
MKPEGSPFFVTDINFQQVSHKSDFLPAAKIAEITGLDCLQHFTSFVYSKRGIGRISVRNIDCGFPEEAKPEPLA